MQKSVPANKEDAGDDRTSLNIGVYLVLFLCLDALLIVYKLTLTCDAVQLIRRNYADAMAGGADRVARFDQPRHDEAAVLEGSERALLVVDPDVALPVRLLEDSIVPKMAVILVVLFLLFAGACTLNLYMDNKLHQLSRLFGLSASGLQKQLDVSAEYARSNAAFLNDFASRKMKDHFQAQLLNILGLLEFYNAGLQHIRISCDVYIDGGDVEVL